MLDIRAIHSNVLLQVIGRTPGVKNNSQSETGHHRPIKSQNRIQRSLLSLGWYQQKNEGASFSLRAFESFTGFIPNIKCQIAQSLFRKKSTATLERQTTGASSFAPLNNILTGKSPDVILFWTTPALVWNTQPLFTRQDEITGFGFFFAAYNKAVLISGCIRTTFQTNLPWL